MDTANLKTGWYFCNTKEEKRKLLRYEAAKKQWSEYFSDHPTIKKEPRPINPPLSVIEKAKTVDVDNLLQRQLTDSEKIDKAFEDYYISHNWRDSAPLVPVTPGFELKVGQAVNSHGPDTVIEEIRENGQLVCLLYTRVSNNYGNPIHTPNQRHVVHWSDVHLKQTVGEEKLLNTSEKGIFLADIGSSNRQINSIIGEYLSYGLDFDADYQRDLVWTVEQKQELILSIMQGRPLGTIVLLDREYPHTTQVVDGKQRINAILDFYFNRFNLNGVYYQNMHFKDKRVFDNSPLPQIRLQENNYNRQKVLEVFLAININGVPQSEEHLNHVKSLLKQSS